MEQFKIVFVQTWWFIYGSAIFYQKHHPMKSVKKIRKSSKEYTKSPKIHIIRNPRVKSCLFI